jgi:hypothetical protein
LRRGKRKFTHTPQEGVKKAIERLQQKFMTKSIERGKRYRNLSSIETLLNRDGRERGTTSPKRMNSSML